MGRVTKSLQRRREHMAEQRLAIGSAKENKDPKAANSILARSALKPTALSSSSPATSHAADIIKKQAEKLTGCYRVIHNIKRVGKRLAETNGKLQQANKVLTGSNQDLTLQVARDAQEKRKMIEAIKKSADRTHELKTKRDTLAKFRSRSSGVKQRAVIKAKRDATTHSLKKSGIITDQARGITRRLIAAGVPETQVTNVIRQVAGGLGQTVSGEVSRRSAGRIALEARVASKLQLGEELIAAKSFTASSDSTSNKNLEYTSRHIALLAPNYSDPSAEPKLKVRYLGLSGDVDHTAETQLDGWKVALEENYNNLKASPKGRQVVAEFEDVIEKLTGMNTDHAEDQKKLVRLIKEWKVLCSHVARGQRIISLTPLDKLQPLLLEINDDMIQSAGGTTAFDSLSGDEQDHHRKNAYIQTCARMGETAFAKLSESEKRAVTLFFWAGCCMHSVKGGNTALKAYWTAESLPGPVKLANKENDAARNLDPKGPAGIRANNVSEGGAVKTCSIAGALFNHKDKKKGHQDTYRIFFEAKLGRLLSFPDTSNTRFQCYCMASAILLVHLELFRMFLDLVQFKKDSHSFNHMEQNLHKALDCPFTITEMGVLVLYSQAINHPYMRRVRSNNKEEQNVLDLAPLHKRVDEHISRIIENPDLLLAPTASYQTGAMDGLEWEDCDAFAAVQEQISLGKVPHLRGALVAFFRGSKDTWGRFTSEFASDGVIATSTPQEKALGAMPNTNDHNEGNLGRMRLIKRHAPVITLNRLNSMEMYRTNDTEGYIKQSSSAMMKFFRSEARTVDASGSEKLRREKIATHDREKAERGRRAVTQSAARKAALDAKISQVKPVSDFALIRGMSKTAVVKQLQWYRKNGRGGPIPAYSALGRDAARVLLEDVVKKHQAVCNAEMVSEPEDVGGAEECEITVVMEEAEITVVMEEAESENGDDDFLYSTNT